MTFLKLLLICILGRTPVGDLGEDVRDTETVWSLEVDQMEVGGREVWTQGHVRVLQLPQDPLVELGADPVELHDVAGILLDPEAVEFLHQVTCRKTKVCILTAEPDIFI